MNKDIINNIRNQSEKEAEEILKKLKEEWGEDKRNADEKLDEKIHLAEEAGAKLASIEETDYEKLAEEAELKLKEKEALEARKKAEEEYKEAQKEIQKENVSQDKSVVFEKLENARDEQGEDSGNGPSKPKRKVGPWIAAPIVGGGIIPIAIAIQAYNAKGLDISKYITAEYVGINGYAKGNYTFDKEAFYNDLAKNENNESKLASYKNFADSIVVTSDDTTIKNGENVKLNISYDNAAMKATGYHIKKDSYSFVANGIAEGKNVNLFQDISVKINGISPEATAIVLNNSEDEYLKTLQYKTDKSTGLANGDRIMITCEVTAQELASHGYTTSGTSVMYDVSGLSTYVSDVNRITKEVVYNVANIDKTMLDEETVDTTFRMVYKLTGNRDFLGLINNESLSDFNISKAYFLKKKSSNKNINDPENILILVNKIKINADDRSEEGYAAVLHYNVYTKADGSTVEVDTSNLKNQYALGQNEEELIQLNVNNKEAGYEITQINLN